MTASPRIAPKRRPGRRLAAAPVAGSPGGVDAASDTIRIRTRGLTKHYGDLVAVDHLDLEVHAGEIFGLLGQNGAGKTTTILMLLGLTEPTEGAARVVGLDPARGPLEVKRRVGYMPDSVGFYGDMTGRQNLRYTAKLNRIPSKEANVTIDEVLEQVGLTDRADDRVDTYSRGMLQRLGIADALVKDPDVLILDEPTTAIDPLGVVEVLDLLRRLVNERGMAILLSSHLLNQVQSVCDRIGIFASGRLIGQGTLEHLAERFGDGRSHLEVGFDVDAGTDADRIRSLIAAIPGVESLDDGERAADPWTITVAPGSDPATVRSAVLAVVAQQHLPLTSIRALVPSLEEIYRRAVQRPALPARRAGGAAAAGTGGASAAGQSATAATTARGGDATGQGGRTGAAATPASARSIGRVPPPVHVPAAQATPPSGAMDPVVIPTREPAPDAHQPGSSAGAPGDDATDSAEERA